MNFWSRLFGFEKSHHSPRARIYREMDRKNNINNNKAQKKTNKIAEKFNIYSGSRLPDDSNELIKRGWKDATHPEKRKKHDGVTYFNPRTSQKVDYDRGDPNLTGFRGKNHYHWYNPDSTDKKANYYLDKYGRPCGKGSERSHILPTKQIRRKK